MCFTEMNFQNYMQSFRYAYIYTLVLKESWIYFKNIPIKSFNFYNILQ